MKTRTPFSSVILYLLGIIFMIVAAFMLWAAVNYTKLYLASYDYTFADMWSNSVQYIIEKVLPSFAAGVVCLGLGKAISVFRKGQAVQVDDPVFGEVQEGSGKGNEAPAKSVEEVSLRLKELREVGSIKLEELERREKVRLDDMRETMVRDMALHRLQREAKEEEIISKLNAMGEKMGIDMMELYARADIPVVPELDEEEPESEDKLKNDPLFDELDRAEETPAEEVVEEPAEEVIEEQTTEEVTEEQTEDEPEVPAEEVVEDTPEEVAEEPVEEKTEEVTEDPANEMTEEQTEEEPETPAEEVVDETPAEEEPEVPAEEATEEEEEDDEPEPSAEAAKPETAGRKIGRSSKKKQKRRRKKSRR